VEKPDLSGQFVVVLLTCIRVQGYGSSQLAQYNRPLCGGASISNSARVMSRSESLHNVSLDYTHAVSNEFSFL